MVKNSYTSYSWQIPLSACHGVDSRARRFATLVATALIVGLCATAQTVTWQLPPTADYKEMVRFGPQLYQVTGIDGKVGLIRPDGTVVVPAEADNIGQFYDGMALVTLDESTSRHQILGVLTEDGAYIPFKEKYYTLGKQEFYSDGLLSVENAKGKKGYLDKSGTPACLFDQNYYRIKPFTEGYAAISDKGTTFYLINKNGRRQNLMLPSTGTGHKLLKVYNPVQGKVLALDDYKKCYKFNLASGECEDMNKKVEKEPSTDYLFRPVEVIEAAGMELYKTVPFTQLAKGTDGLKPKKMDGGYGFEEEGRTILPGQLTSATPFEDDLSIVTIGGRMGLLRHHTGQKPFSVNSEQELYHFDKGSDIACGFKLDIPQAWGGKQINVSLIDNSIGEKLHPEFGAQGYSINLHPSRSGQKEFAVSVTAEGLHLWTGQLVFNLKRNPVPLQLSGLQLDDNITDSKYKVTGSFNIYNPNEDEVETELSFSHSALVTTVGGFNQKVTLKPDEQKHVTFYIVTSNKRGTWDHTVTVTSSKGGSATVTKEIETF